ncbi:MAG: alkaline phosphatase family protein [Burkholderiaceae bacterium]|nr:alkaline phosphatase family protein [Roseateles sp.]MBV8471285.1 alkaline phosphatase family protein [Burkholderiaceae bacterium]
MTTASTPHPSRRRLLMASTLAPVLSPALAAASQTSPSAPGGSRQPGVASKPDAQRMRIAFGSCARQEKPQPIWATIAATQPDLFVFLGDNFYADARDEATLRKRYDEFEAVETLQAFRRATPHVAMWDDHDFGDDDVGGDYPLKDLSQRLFCDAWQEGPDSPRRRRSGVYESYRFESGGHTVQLILMDLRFNRTALVADPALRTGYDTMLREAKLSGKPMKGWYVANPSPEASMLGEEQWAWLEQQLREPADVRLIGSSVQFAADGSGWEGWANFPRERQRLVDLIRSTRAEGVVILSGDMHYAEFSRWEAPQGYPLWDITSSGLTEVWAIPTPNSKRASAVLAEANFGLIDIQWPSKDQAGPPDAQIQMSIIDVKGVTRLSHNLTLNQLRFPIA